MNALHQLKVNVMAMYTKTQNKHLLRVSHHINILEAILGVRAPEGATRPDAVLKMEKLVSDANEILNAEGVTKSRAASAHAQVIYTALCDALANPKQKKDANTEQEIKTDAAKLPVSDVPAVNAADASQGVKEGANSANPEGDKKTKSKAKNTTKT